MMPNRVNLEEVAQAVAAAAPELDAVGRRIFVQTFRLVARGEPVSPAEIAQAAGVARQRAEESLHSWPLAFWDDQDRIVGFWGLAIRPLKPTHSMAMDGRTVYGWCAWDTLFIPEILNTEIHVKSTDPQNGETVQLTVTPDEVKEVHPRETMVSFLLPVGPVRSDVVQSFCHFVHFFSSPESGQRWIADHPGTFLLTVEEAFELGRLTNQLRMMPMSSNRPGSR
jgi:alkylmercury lyase